MSHQETANLGHQRIPVSAIILTHNEESNVAQCLRSVAGWAGEVFVVDSGSTDRTLEIATGFGATIVRHPFETHARQWAWAVQTLPCSFEWILGLDADQRLTPELQDELRRLFTASPSPLAAFDGFYIKRRQVFRGRWIRHGGYYPKYLLKLFRCQQVRMDLDDLVDHHFAVEGRTGRLQHDLIEENMKENAITFWTEKHNRYATLLAREEFARRRNRRGRPPRLWSADPDERTHWMKQMWWSLPLYVRPFLYFLYRYVFRLGFLDGKEGLVFHFLQGCWFRFLVDVKLDQMLQGSAEVEAVRERGAVDYPRD